jgi:hypothetical protein
MISGFPHGETIPRMPASSIDLPGFYPAVYP